MKRVFRDLFPYAVFLLLAFITWNRWIEPYVDSGRELMVPRRLAQGEALYREVHFHHGPLAPYLAAGIDSVAGPSLCARTLFAALLALLQLEALRRLALRFLAPARAALATALAVGIAFFLRPGGWLFPFSFDTALAVLALTWALVLLPRGDRRSDLWVAACLLAALLSRLELGVLGICAAALEALEARQRARRLVLLAAVPLGAAGLTYGLLSARTPFETLIADGWLRLARPPEAFQNVYRSYAGLDRPALRLAELALAGLLLLAVAALLAVGSKAAESLRGSGSRPLLVEGVALAALVVSAILHLRPPESQAPTLFLLPPLVRVVPIAVAAFAGIRLWQRITRRSTPGFPPQVSDAILLVAALFGARLLLAAGYAGPYNAFFLPLPLLVALTALHHAADRGRDLLGSSFPRLLSGSLAILLLFRIAVLTQIYRGPGWTAVSTPAGSLTLPRAVGEATQQTLADLTRRVPPDGTLAGFPEVGFFNYVLDRRNPLPLEQFFPGHLDENGQRRIVAMLRENPPNAVLLVNVLAVGEGARVFGKDYLSRVDDFLQQSFLPAASFGPGAGPQPRIGDPDFFLEVRVPREP